MNEIIMRHVDTRNVTRLCNLSHVLSAFYIILNAMENLCGKKEGFAAKLWILCP